MTEKRLIVLMIGLGVVLVVCLTMAFTTLYQESKRCEEYGKEVGAIATNTYQGVCTAFMQDGSMKGKGLR